MRAACEIGVHVGRYDGERGAASRDDRGDRSYRDRGDRRSGDRGDRGYRSDHGGYRDDRGGYRDDRGGYQSNRGDRGGYRGEREADDRRGGYRGDRDRRDGRPYADSYRSWGDRDERGGRGYRGERDGYRDDRGGYRSDRGGYRSDRDDDGRRGYRDGRDRGESYRSDRDDQRGYRGGRDGYRSDREDRGGNRGDGYRSGRDGYRSGRGDTDRRDGRRDDRGSRRDDRPRNSYDEYYGREDLRSGYDAYDYDADYDAYVNQDGQDDEVVDDGFASSRAQRVYEPLSCPVSHRCGGCEWLSMPYDQQLQMKQEDVAETFADLRCAPEPIVGMDDPTHFRNKVQLPFAPGHELSTGRLTVRWGIFERGTHHIVGTRSCLVEDTRARPIIAFIADMLPRFNIKPYDERTGEGFMRYVLVRTALHTGQIMVVLVANGTRLPSDEAFISRLREKFPAITTIVLNVNKGRTSVILGNREKVLYGPGYIEDTICGCRFRISPSSFYQTNPVQAEKLYDIAIQMAGLKPTDRFGDAYCGTGTIGIAAAKASGAHLLGVERNPEAIEDARVNAEMNGITDADFVVGDAGSVFARMARAGEDLDVVFMDPPRAGANQAFLANLSRLSPRRVVYISCNPRSQHHDLLSLIHNGYHVKRIVPVDMFPHTNHVETVVLLERPVRKQAIVDRRRERVNAARDDEDATDEYAVAAHADDAPLVATDAPREAGDGRPVDLDHSALPDDRSGRGDRMPATDAFDDEDGNGLDVFAADDDEGADPDFDEDADLDVFASDDDDDSWEAEPDEAPRWSTPATQVAQQAPFDEDEDDTFDEAAFILGIQNEIPLPTDDAAVETDGDAEDADHASDEGEGDGPRDARVS